jgi:hypothetical protein
VLRLATADRVAWFHLWASLMSLPESISTLLALGSSPASQALRWGLHGLRAALCAALEEAPNTAGADELRVLLADLDTLLAAGPRSSATDPVLPTYDRSDQGPTAPRFLPLVHALAEDQRIRADLRSGSSDEETWNDIQRLLLRLPAALAGEWQQRCLEHAQKIGARPDESRTAVVPLLHDDLIYPGLTGAVEANGLRSDASAALDPRVKPPAESGLRFLAGVVSTCLWFIDNDPLLCHCLKGVFRFGVAPLKDEQRERYVGELLRLWERVVAGRAEPSRGGSRQWFKDRLRELLDLDEALHSLVYQPLAAPDSWWGRLLNEVRDTLFQARDPAAAAGCPVHLQALGGSFADINRLAPDSLQVDFGTPGEVAACLRVWARLDGEEIKGRVLYRSPQEES